MSYLAALLFAFVPTLGPQGAEAPPTPQDATEGPGERRELVVQAGHGGVRYSARRDGSVIAAYGASGIQFWNSRGRLLRTITHLGRVNYLAINPVHDVMVSGGRILDFHGNPVVELVATRVHEGKTYTYSPGGQGYKWSFDGERLAVRTTTGVLLFNRQGEMLADLPGYAEDVCFSGSGEELFAAVTEHYSNAPTIHVWNLEGEKLRSFPAGEARKLRYLVVSNDGEHVAVSLTRNRNVNRGEGPIQRIFTPEGQLVKDLRIGEGEAGNLMAFGESGFLTTEGDDVKHWSGTGELLGEIPGFYIQGCTDEMLIGIPRGENSTVPKGLWGYRFLDIEGNLLHELPGEDAAIDAVATSPTADLIATLDHNGRVRVLKFTGEVVNTFQPLDEAGEPLLGGWKRRPFDFGRDGKSLVIYIKNWETKREALHRYALSGDLLERRPLPYGERSAPEFVWKWMGPARALTGLYSQPLPDGKHFVKFDRGEYLLPLGNPGAPQKKYGDSYISYQPDVAFSPDGQRIYFLGGGRLVTLEAATGKELSTVRVDMSAKQIAASPDGKHLAYTGARETDGTITLLDTDGNKIKELAHPAVQSTVGVRGPVFTHDGRGIVTAGKDGSLRIWLWEKDQAVNWLFRGDQWIMFTDEGLFDGSRGGGEMLGMTVGTQSFTVDQFALRLNRPDLILKLLDAEGVGEGEATGSSNTDGGRGISVVARKAARRNRTLVDHYYAQYQRRLRRAGLTEADLQTPLHAPEVSATLEGVKDGIAHLKVRADDSLYSLTRLFTWVNGVPAGEQVLEASQFEGEIEVALGAGENRIEVSVLNNRGAESLRGLVDVMHEVDERPALHVVALGVSDYRDDDLDLAFAHQDARDLAARLQRNGKDKYSAVNVHLLTDGQVTQSAVRALFEPLGQVGIHDTLLLFVAGHGVHDQDEESTWYFLTHEADLGDLANSAVPFAVLEELLTQTPARHKLFLMDACESGEREEDWLALASPPGNMRPRTSKKLTERTSSSLKSSAVRSIDRNRYIFYNLLRRSGAIVYSSSRGSEFSYEDPAIRNGWFTEMVLEALSGAADRDGDGWIDSYELRSYVTPRVARKTEGRQHPTVDRDNVHQRVRLPSGK